MTEARATQPTKSMPGKRMARLLWVITLLLVGVLAAKLFLADIYRISSGSMRPTLLGGRARADDEPFSEWVLVRYGRPSELERYSLLVIEPKRGDPVVKRLVGLPGESLRIVDGDILIDGQRLPHDAPRPAPTPVFDDRLFDLEDYFSWKRDSGSADSVEGAQTWRRGDEREWILDATGVASGSNEGMMFYRPELRDDTLDHEGRRVVGERSVNDAILECEFALDAAEGRLRFQLVEKGDTFEARILPNTAPGAVTSHTLQLVRRSPSMAGAERVVETLDLNVTRLKFQSLRFSNIDNALTVSLPELGVRLTHTYESNERDPRAGRFGDQSVGDRAGLGGEGIRAKFRAIRISRDLHYTSGDNDAHGVKRAVNLGPDEIFVLGDHSRISNDSRQYGPVALGEILGTPRFVVWPLGRARKLTGAKAAPGQD